MQWQLEATQRAAVLGGLNTATIANLVLVLPPTAEQLTLLAGLREGTKGLIAAVSRVERKIDLLHEYRSRLIADVVTGKLDVREAAGRLPDEKPSEIVEADTSAGDEAESADEEVVV